MSYRVEIRLALLLATAIAIAVWAAHRTPKPPVSDFRTSTYLSGPRGSRGLYDVLVTLRRPVQRRRTPLFTFNADSARRPALLVVLNPPMALQPAEMERVVRYVKNGGAVLSAGNGGGIIGCAGWRREPEGWGDDSVAVERPLGARRLPRVGRVLVQKREQSAVSGRLEGLVKRKVETPDPCDSLVATRRDTLLAARDGRPVLLRLWYPGGGSITLAADAGWFSNQVWRDSDVPVVIVPLFDSPRGERGRIVMDEYHQGFGRDEQTVSALTWEWLRQSPLGWAIMQILAIALVWLAVMAVRFGPAREVVERRRRSPLEHLEALGAGLESAEDADTAVQRLVSGLQRRLGGARPGSAEPWLQSLELAMRGTQGRAAVRRLRHLINERNRGGADDRVLAAAQAVEDVWEELRPRTTRNAS